MKAPVFVVAEFECVGVHNGDGDAFGPYTFSRVFEFSQNFGGDPGKPALCPVCHRIRYAKRERLALSPAAASDLIRETAFALRDAIKPPPDLYTFRRGNEPAPVLDELLVHEAAAQSARLARIEARIEVLEACDVNERFEECNRIACDRLDELESQVKALELRKFDESTAAAHERTAMLARIAALEDGSSSGGLP